MNHAKKDRLDTTNDLNPQVGLFYPAAKVMELNKRIDELEKAQINGPQAGSFEHAIERLDKALDGSRVALLRIAELETLLFQCPEYMQHLSWRCEHYKKCQCQLDQLKAEIEKARGE